MNGHIRTQHVPTCFLSPFFFSFKEWIVVFQAILSILPIIIQLILMLLSPTVKPLKKLVEVLLETNDYLTPILPVCSFVGALKILVLKDNSNLSDLYKLYHGDNK